MQQRSPRSIVIAIITGLCGLAGTLATVLPESQLQQGAEKVANACEANGFRAWPEVVVPAPHAEDAGTPSPTLPPVLEAPAPAGTQRAELGVPSPYQQPHSRSWTWLPAVESWPGEARGWA